MSFTVASWESVSNVLFSGLPKLVSTIYLWPYMLNGMDSVVCTCLFVILASVASRKFIQKRCKMCPHCSCVCPFVQLSIAPTSSVLLCNLSICDGFFPIYPRDLVYGPCFGLVRPHSGVLSVTKYFHKNSYNFVDGTSKILTLRGKKA